MNATATAPSAPAAGTTKLHARDIADGVRRGELDAVAVVRDHLERIAALDGQLHAFTVVREHQALQEAEELSRRADLDTLPLAGVPVAVKENMHVVGHPTLHGSAALQHRHAHSDSIIVRRLRDAGAIVIGKTAMSELAIWPFTEGPGWATRNPLNPERTCGGSSGGSAVAVASGMAALATATDGGGSTRIPAACCGIVGVKTTRGAVPLPDGAHDHWYGLSVAGPLARDVHDAALMLDVLTGRRPPRLRMQQLPHNLQVAMSVRNPVAGAPVDREVKDAVRRVAYYLAAAGHDVVEANPPYPQLPVTFLRSYLAGIAEDAEALGLDLDAAEPRTRAMAQRGQWLRRRGLDRHAASHGVAYRLQRWMAQRDVLVTPVLAYPPPKVGRWKDGGWFRTALSVGRWMGFCPPWNLAGCPAVVVPVAHDRDGLAIGVQLVGAPASERLLLAVAAAVEESAPH
ncbi:MAG: amidase [Candidatus Dormibacteraeota bacterium]|nr:amidase [Candidatus Dormibacteraeota bacterium]